MSSLVRTLRPFSISSFSQKSRTGKSGILCDIDGVLLRGRTVLAGARQSIKALYERKFPVLFLTNQGMQTEQEKAANLSEILNVQVKPEQVVLSHSPLHLHSSLHDQFVLALGQQNVQETAFSLGFKNICEIEDIQAAYPMLDMVDKKRRYMYLSKQGGKQISKIEGIVLLGEPIRWETTLQLVIDLLVSNGNPSQRLPHPPVQHIPVVACNTDLLWMAEAPIPRFGHGAFLVCLESLYKKITGNTLQYTMLTGKPFLVTFQYAERIIQKYLETKYKEQCFLERIYVIGDNPDTDIYGGNIYKQYVQNLQLKEHSPPKDLKESVVSQSVHDVISILVNTGVHCKSSVVNEPILVHKDVMFDPMFRNPDYAVQNIEDAVRLIVSSET